jgi:hypothetical protein
MEGGEQMSPNMEEEVCKIKQRLQSFLDIFNQYSDEIYGDHNQAKLDQLRTQLQRMEPQVSKYIVEIIGGGTVTVGSFGLIQRIAHIDLLPTALMGSNNELPHNFHDFKEPATMLLNRALGCIDTELWPPKEPEPTLLIRDEELKQRCFDLLKAPGHFDRVIREATVILEDRIRNKIKHDILTKLIPQSADQTGENLINRLLSPSSPVIIFSEDKEARIAFHKILIGFNAFLRNPHHHHIDDKIEWSWAWSIIGFVDKLLLEIEKCTVTE